MVSESFRLAPPVWVAPAEPCRTSWLTVCGHRRDPRPHQPIRHPPRSFVLSRSAYVGAVTMDAATTCGSPTWRVLPLRCRDSQVPGDQFALLEHAILARSRPLSPDAGGLASSDSASRTASHLRAKVRCPCGHVTQNSPATWCPCDGCQDSCCGDEPVRRRWGGSPAEC